MLAVGGAFFLAELGDKTMLATITLATQHGWFGTWIGSTIGMVAADALAILVGRLLGRHLPGRPSSTVRRRSSLSWACGSWSRGSSSSPRRCRGAAVPSRVRRQRRVLGRRIGLEAHGFRVDVPRGDVTEAEVAALFVARSAPD